MANLEVIIKMDGTEKVYKASEKAGKGMDNLGKKTKKTNTTMSGMVKTLKRVAIGLGALVILKKVVKWFASATKAANIQRLAEQRLALAMKNTQTFTKKAWKENLKYASSLQKVTIYGDEVILSGMNLLVTLAELEGEGLKRATQATLDLASATGMDLNAAFILMSKAAAGQVSSLSRYGLIIESTGDKGKDFVAVLELIEKQMGGQSQLAANDLTGKVTQLGNAWGDLKEKIGSYLNDNPKLIKAVDDLIKYLENNEGQILRTAEALGKMAADIASLVIPTVEALSTIVRALSGDYKLAEDGTIGWINTTINVIKAIAQAVGIAIGYVLHIIVEIERKVLAFAGKMFAAGVKIIKNLAAGMKSVPAQAAVDYALGKITGLIAAKLKGNSPVPEGPLADLRENGGENIANELAAGMMDGLPAVAAAAEMLAAAANPTISLTAADIASGRAAEFAGGMGVKTLGQTLDMGALDLGQSLGLGGPMGMDIGEGKDISLAGEMGLEDINEDAFQRMDKLKNANQKMWDDMKGAAKSGAGQMIAGSYMKLAEATAMLVTGQKIAGKEFGKAMLMMTAQSILAVGQMAAVDALYALAKGLYYSAMPGLQGLAPPMYAAAQMFGAIAVGALAVGGSMMGAAKSMDSGSAGGGGAGGGGGYGGGGGGYGGRAPTPEEEGGGSRFVVNMNVEGDLLDPSAFAEKIMPALAEVAGRGMLGSDEFEFNITRK